MRRIAYSLALVAAALFVWSPAEAIDDNAGTAGYSFLKIGVGARPAGMANAYVGLADDYSALYYNPAGIAGARLSTLWEVGTEPVDHESMPVDSTWAPILTPAKPERKFVFPSPATYVAASYNSWISDFQSGFLALVSPVTEETWLGASIQYMNYGDLTETDADGNVLGEFGASGLAFALTGATRLSGNITLGLTGRVILESIADSSSWGLAADVGAMYYLPDNRTQFGVAVTNLGAQMKGLTESHKDKLPTKFAFGASHKLRGLPLVVAGDVTKAIDDHVRFSLGSELVYFAPFYLRTGYSSRRGDIETGSSSDGWSGLVGGFGVTFNKLRLDYALGHLSELGTVHRVGLTARL